MKVSAYVVHGWFLSILWTRSSTMARMMRFLGCGVAALLSLWGCAARYSTEALHAVAPSADIVDVCTRIPSVEDDSRVWAHKMSSRLTVSDRDWQRFESFAETADVVYRYDPNAPEESAQRLPWPYNKMSCSTLSSSWKAPPLPEKMREISISVETREALVASLTQGCGSVPTPQAMQNVSDKLFVGQLVSPIGLGRTGTFREAHWDEIKQTLRDAVKDFAQTGTAGPMPHLQEAKKQFWKDWPKPATTPFDSPKEQLLIGAIGGSAGALVPGGPVVTQVMIDSGVLPEGTQEARLGKALAEVGIGGGQFFIGADATIIGGGLSLSGGGAVIGVPTCAAGISLATQGAITFCNGAKSLAIILCNWQEQPIAEAQPLAAAAPKDAVSSAPAPQSGGATTAATTPPVKPAAQPVQPAKPSANPTKPAAKPNAPSGGQTPGPKPKHYGSGTKVGNTTTWVRCTGQVHHAISAKIHAALENHQNLKGLYKYRDNRFMTQAFDKAAHNGYQKWHKSLDREIVSWLEDNKKATMADFEVYLRQRYAKSDLKAAFPNGL